MTRTSTAHACSFLDELSEIEAMVDMIHMASNSLMDEDDQRVFAVATRQLLLMVKAITAKAEAA